MNDCRIVARYSIGIDNVDVEAAAEGDIYVTNVPDYYQEVVVSHTLTLLLGLYRGVTQYDTSVADDKCDRDVATPIHRLSM